MLALPPPHAGFGSLSRAFSFGHDSSHAGTERLLAPFVGLGLGIGRRWLELAASSRVVFGATFGSQTSTFGHRQLLAAANG